LIHIDTLLWFAINASYVTGEIIVKQRQKPMLIDRGSPQFFYELVQYCVAFDWVKIFTKYGLTLTFNENLKEWSSNLHCIVQLLRKTTQTKEDKERATQCIDTLFGKDTTENWGHFGRTELGTKSHLQKRSNFALPVVILTWQRMLLKHFHDNTGETSFELGNYSARPTKYAAAPLDNLYLIKRDTIKEGQDKQIFSFDCFNIKEELSILLCADYILQQDANLETTNEKKQELECLKIDQ
jgi:hypothetical protein